MSKRESINRQYLIIKAVKSKACTFEYIHDYLARESEYQGYNFTVSKRTFQRDLEDIRFSYDIDIQYDYSRKVYFVEEKEDSTANDRIVEAFDTFNALNLTERIGQYIHFEKRKPRGTEHLYGLLHAIKNKFQIRYSYFKFWDDAPTNRSVDPLALKEFNNRWYLLAKDEKDQAIKTFALDRMSALHISNKKHTFSSTFDVEEHFKYCFGIISPNDSIPEDIVLSLDPFQGKYIKSLPLHESQVILVDNESELRIQLKLCVTHDFVMELLSLGSNLTVIQPASLIEEMKASLKSTLAHYEH